MAGEQPRPSLIAAVLLQRGMALNWERPERRSPSSPAQLIRSSCEASGTRWSARPSAPAAPSRRSQQSSPPCSVSSALRADEVIGIDLGTTNSCVAVMEGKARTCCEDANPAVLQSREGAAITGWRPLRIAQCRRDESHIIHVLHVLSSLPASRSDWSQRLVPSSSTPACWRPLSRPACLLRCRRPR